jgi:hypothetical protein
MLQGINGLVKSKVRCFGMILLVLGLLVQVFRGVIDLFAYFFRVFSVLVTF